MAIHMDEGSPAKILADIWRRQRRQAKEKLLSTIGDRMTNEELELLGIRRE